MYIYYIYICIVSCVCVSILICSYIFLVAFTHAVYVLLYIVYLFGVLAVQSFKNKALVSWGDRPVVVLFALLFALCHKEVFCPFSAAPQVWTTLFLCYGKLLMGIFMSPPSNDQFLGGNNGAFKSYQWTILPDAMSMGLWGRIDCTCRNKSHAAICDTTLLEWSLNRRKSMQAFLKVPQQFN